MNTTAVAGGDANNTTGAAWDGVIPGGSLTGSNSGKPATLTDGTNSMWIGTVNAVTPFSTEWDNGFFACGPNVSTAPLARTALHTPGNWTVSNTTAAFTLPTGCNFLGVLSAPGISGQPSNSAICEGANTSFTITATGATGYQWQVDNGGGFANITDDATYNGALTATLNITAAPFSLNGYLYRCIASNGSGSTNSNSASLTVTPLPVAPTLLAKTPASITVADGTPVSATFNAGSGGTGCTDDFRFTTNGGISYLPYTPGANISTTGLAAGGGTVVIEGRRAGCSSACQGSYVGLVSWVVTPLPAGATTLSAGDIAFASYASSYLTPAEDNFSFVLLRSVGPGTTINFTNNGWLSTNVFRAGEETVTWTAPAGGLIAGTEIRITDLTATKTGGGNAGTVTGTGLNLNTGGDQVLAYQGAPGSPTFISAIHMNVYNAGSGDPVTTTAAAWDGTANTSNSSALPTGLTTGTNCIWIGTQGIPASEFNNARYGNCSAPAVSGPVTVLRALLNNQANWIKDDNTPPSFTLPTGCNYLGTLVPTITVTGTPLAPFAACGGSNSPEQSFTVSGAALSTDIIITAPGGFEVSTTSGSGFNSSVTLTLSGGGVPTTTIYVRTTTAASGTPSGNITIASTGVTTINAAVSATIGINPTAADAGIDAGVCALTYTLTGNIPVSGTGTWTQQAGPGTATFVDPTQGNTSVTVDAQGAYTFRWSITGSGICPVSFDEVAITFSNTPTVAAAGPDGTACVSPATYTMAANTPVVGTGSWSQLPGGPGTAIIFTPGSPTTNIGNLSAPGVYTFRWTISNGSCTASTDDMTITVNTNPALFTLAGGGTFCPGTTTLTGPIDPNYTYIWQRSLTGIANPNSFTSFGGTSSTQDVTLSGNYRLIVANQFGCSVSDTTPVSMADFVFNGSLATGDAQQTGRLNRFATVSTCAAPKACPLTFTTTGARFYDSYTITNIRNVPVCATIGLRSDCGTSLFNVAYLGSFNPTALCTNYLADPGSSFPGTGYMEVTIPANATIEVVVHEVNPGTGCAGYQLTVDVPRESGVTVNPSTPICSATPVTLTAPVAGTYSWNPGGNTTQSIVVTPAVTTKYYVTLGGYGNNGCTGLDSANVVVNQLPTTADAGLDAAVCALNYTLAGNTPTVGTGTWTQVAGPGTASFTDANLATSGVSVSANGIYTFRWTIATGAPCPNSSQDDVTVNFAGTPSVADAGIDKTACISPGRATMTAAVPAVGTGVWSQVAGPVTASIISPNAPNTLITGLNTLGTYTFRWTVSNSPCPSNFDEVNVVVNSNPASFTITGGGTFCPSGTTLVGPVDPNYTYQWGKSYLSAPFAGVGTAQTLAVTSSGIYELVVTNQFGCSTSNTTVVNAADYVFTGSLATGDAVQTGRLNRFAAISTCAAPKACPGTFTTTGSRVYDSYTITNPRPVPVCAVIGLNSGCGTAIFSVAYTGSYDPNNLCTNYLADPGSSPSTSIFYEATIPANGTIVVVVHEVNPAQGCANYTLTVDVPRDMSAIVANPPSVTCASISTLTAPIANSYLWTPGGAPTRSMVTAPLFVPTQYKVTLGYGNNGCSREDSVTVAVTSLPPTVTCPANITLSNTVGLCGRAVTYSAPVGGLPAPTVTYSLSGATTGSGSGTGSGTLFNVGTTTVTITVTNLCGTTNCSFTVTINDTEPPTVTTGSMGSGYASVAAAEAAALAATSATDNCPGVLTEVASTVGTCSAVITVTTTDIAGNSTAVTYNTRIDNTAPVITCPAPVTVSCASAVPAANISLVTVTDNCPGVITVIHVGDVISAQTCTNRFTVTRTYRATDGCGNFAECTQIITVNDQTAPTLTCPAPVTVSCAAAVPVPDINSVTGVTDNCGGPVTVTHVSDVISAQTCLNRYTITRTYRATDVCGNFAECTQIITVNDQTPPVITCPANITVNNTPNQCGAIVNFTVTATDNCAGAITITSVPASGSFFPVGTTTVTSTAVDACGNTSTCTFTVTVVDVQPPVITCPANITTGNNPGICGAVVNFPLPTVSDNCPLPGGVTLNQNTNTTTIAFNTGISCNAGATSFWRAYNLASFPAVTGPLTINSVRFGIEVNNTGVAQTMTVNLYNQTGAAFPGGTRTLIATGTVSITAAANTFYTVNFGSAPTVPANAIIIVEVATPVGGVFPAANGLGESGPSYISSTACGVPNPVTLASLGFTANHTIIGMSGTVPVVPPILVQTAGLPSGSTFPVGTTTNTFVARDNAGNTSTCSFTVTVNDVEQPTITCPGNQVRNTDPGVCYATFPDPPGIPRPTFADNCAVTRLTWSMTGPGGTTTSPASGINYVPNNTQFLLNGTTGTGVTTITYTAADAAGNTRTCSFTVTVNDASIPVISVQPATVFVCEGGNAVFSVTATAGAGNPLAYQWQQWNGSAWVNIGGATSSTLTIPAVAFTQNTNTYRVVLTGRCSVVNSAAATLFVNPLPSVTLLTSIPPAIQPGQSLNITSNVNPPGGTYAWFLNGQLLPTALGSSLNNLTVDNLGTYRLVYTDLNGCVGTSANLVISAFQSEKLWIYPNPNTGRFQIRFFNHVNEQITINVYDMKGSRVYQRAVTPTANYTRIDVDLGTAIPAGFYIVEVRGGNGSLIGKKKIVVYHN
ncbi:MAG: HYR domain-containing protein [Chitinophagaceae bacterium]|nr:HYR domain-containing protein [Chitinophagaceae bacterium]